MKNSERLSRLFQQAGCNLFDSRDSDDRRLVADLPYDAIVAIMPDAETRNNFVRQIAFQERAPIFAKLLDTFSEDEGGLQAIIMGLRDDEKYASNTSRDDRFGVDSDPQDLRAKKSALQKFILKFSGNETPERKPKP